MSPKCAKCGAPISANVKRILAKRERICRPCRGFPLGTKRMSDLGYIQIKTKGGWKAEHRLIMGEHFGRPLERHEVVHHIDGDKTNNSIDNLVVCRSLREHLDNYHADDLVNPPTHHNSRRKIKLGPMNEEDKVYTNHGALKRKVM